MNRSAVALAISLLAHVLVLGQLTLPALTTETPETILVRLTRAQVPASPTPEISPIPERPVTDSPAREIEPPGGAPEEPEAGASEGGEEEFAGPDEVSVNQTANGVGSLGGGDGSAGEEGEAEEPAPIEPELVPDEPAGPDLDFILNAYRAEVRAAISAHKTYPSIAHRLGQEGEVRVRFQVAADGAVSGIEVVSSSGVDALDEAARDAVAAADPVPPIPSELEVDTLTLSILIVFTLD